MKFKITTLLMVALLLCASSAFGGIGSPMIEGKALTTTLMEAQGADVASANALTLGNDGNAFDITGTTTINTIATQGVGTRVTLQFDGILQLTHSADLVLPTGSNITTAAGDIAVFYEYASGDWRCETYTRADGTALSADAALLLDGSTQMTGPVKMAQGSDVASANNMTLGNDGNFFDITGTTTINTIATKAVGTRVTLQFDGILQLTHSADLVLPTGANITTAAGDIASFYEYATGDWRCDTYLRADGTALVDDDGLTSVAVQTGAYSANANEWVPCNVAAGGFTVTLPATPANGTRMVIANVTVAAGNTNVLQIDSAGGDTFAIAAGPTSLYSTEFLEVYNLQYDASKATWELIQTAAPSNYAVNFPGIDAQTPLTSADISVDTGTRVLTVTPPLGYFNIVVNGDGRARKFRKDGAQAFPAFTDTSGMWYFYFNSSGTATTTQTPWTGADFHTSALVYRLYWNATETGADKLVDEYVEYHENDIPADTHQWLHLYGAVWVSGGVMTNNALTSGAPAADGSETVIGLSTVTVTDDNLEYTVTNASSPSADWEQDLGETNAGSLDATNSGQFEIFVQDGAGLVTYLPATRFPFDWGSGDNIPQYITSTGTRTDVTNTYYMVWFVYATQNPNQGVAVKLVSAPTEYADITSARSVTWTTIQNTYSILNDGEIRPLYRLISQVRHSASPYPAGAKYTALRETQDLRKAEVTSTTVATGSLPASSVTVVAAGNISSTNAQAALEELDTEKFQLAGVAGGQTAIGGTASGDDLILQSTSDATKGLFGFDIPTPTAKYHFGHNAAYSAVFDMYSTTNSTMADIAIRKSSSGTLETLAQTADGEDLGSISWYGVKGTLAWAIGARIRVAQDSTTNVYTPGALIFETYERTSGVRTNAYRINSSGGSSWNVSAVSIADFDMRSSSGATELALASNSSDADVTLSFADNAVIEWNIKREETGNYLEIWETGVGMYTQYAPGGNIGWGGVTPTQKYEFAHTSDFKFAVDLYSVTNTDEAEIAIRKNGNATYGGWTKTVDEEEIGDLTFYGVNTGETDWAPMARMRVEQEGNAGATYNPSKLILEPTSSSGYLSYKLVLDTNGLSGINTGGNPAYEWHVGGASVSRIGLTTGGSDDATIHFADGTTDEWELKREETGNYFEIYETGVGTHFQMAPGGAATFASTVDGETVVNLSTAATVTVSGTNQFYVNNDDDAIEFDLPADPTGNMFCFRNRYAQAITIDPNGTDVITMTDTAASAGEAVVSTGAADEYICLAGVDTSNWIGMGIVGTWAEETP